MVKKQLVEISGINRELREAMKTGKVKIGSRETIKAIKKKEAKIVIYSSNCPEEIKKEFMNVDEDVIVYEYPANSVELGLVCGKPYSVASLCIIDVGTSEILQVLQDIHSHSRETRSERR
ncbi:MAG: 50S ribosomal protein L30e [Candidatus Methanospirareceae archaeon]